MLRYNRRISDSVPSGERRRRVRKGGASQTANSKQRVTQTAKEAQALALRITGASYAQIAQALGFQSKNAAWKMVESALKKTIQEPADEVRALEVQRLDRWLLNIDAQIRSGSLEALDRGLKIMTRRATLLGLDAPTKMAPTTPDGAQPYTISVVYEENRPIDEAGML
jgi:hypothetical protein